MSIDAVVVAAGASSRFGGRNKLFEPLRGIPVIGWTLRAIAASSIGRAVFVAHAADHAEIDRLAAEHHPGLEVITVEGGTRRRDSVEAGLRACSTRYVAILDGARPLVTPELIERTCAAAEGNPGAIAAMRVTDTIKEAADGVIRGHPDRERLWAAQTPQVVLRQAWLDAARMGDDDETDDAAMLDRLGLACVVVESDATNLKITRPLDITVAEAVLREREAECG